MIKVIQHSKINMMIYLITQQYIYATTKDGWARINSSTYKGWINLEKVQITEVY